MNTKQPDEEVSVDELGKRYARIYAQVLAKWARNERKYRGSLTWEQLKTEAVVRYI